MVLVGDFANQGHTENTEVALRKPETGQYP